ncbi:cupin domain-containing protein [Naumannella halotolerans]|uniref:Cupin domain-containing protein n=1 Tax=Naumannella halotolerans TaxID=993414 RepID=A0A4R7J913_9ACTN|nr:cupin domain-containing protein [Naumannella halotolerans]TDT33784.1 Cupin domain-containing protein [Naumannella halotolerans]
MTTASIPPDDPRRTLTVAHPDAADATHITLAGNIYTMLVSGADTAGRYCLIDMRIPEGGGPPPHRHDFEEMFTILSGQIEFTLRGETTTVGEGTTVNIPANAPHFFRNTSDAPARMLCMCAPAGQDEYFARVGIPITDPDSPPPAPTEQQQAESRRLAESLAATYRTELLS